MTNADVELIRVEQGWVSGQVKAGGVIELESLVLGPGNEEMFPVGVARSDGPIRVVRKVRAPFVSGEFDSVCCSESSRLILGQEAGRQRPFHRGFVAAGIEARGVPIVVCRIRGGRKHQQRVAGFGCLNHKERVGSVMVIAELEPVEPGSPFVLDGDLNGGLPIAAIAAHIFGNRLDSEIT